ncbi:zinc finger protein 628-like [Ischnura elegans]|uniref:zinc finger protein 628-like n=1 Tax=Ischnura elegans TaxID=197161 RepID=UPI001ED8A4B7|nr:zinc finger protein 628-like [Ischnura elegans]
MNKHNKDATYLVANNIQRANNEPDNGAESDPDEMEGIRREVEYLNKAHEVQRLKNELLKQAEDKISGYLSKSQQPRRITMQTAMIRNVGGQTVIVKKEHLSDEEEILEDENGAVVLEEEFMADATTEGEVVLETVAGDGTAGSSSSHIISQTMVSAPELVEEVIQGNEEDEDEEEMMDESGEAVEGLSHAGNQAKILRTAPALSQHQYKLSPGGVYQSPRGRKPNMKYKQQVLGIDDSLQPRANDPARQKVDKNDLRSRLHFVKYMKRDGKTLKIWECGICAKEFRHQYTLMRHLPTHTDERNFKCETCGKAFRQMSTLSQHRAIHSDARPYVCEFCKKTFNRVSTLISHRKTHSENKPHKCQMCGKGFHQKGNLRNHVFTHTNERPYKCELCGKGFNQMSNLMCHKVQAHAHADKSVYECNICHKEFPRRFALRTHEEYKHGIKYRAGGERRQEYDPLTFREIVNRKQRRRDEKNLRIIHLPNGDRTLADVREIVKGNLATNATTNITSVPSSPNAPHTSAASHLQRVKVSKMFEQDGIYPEKSCSSSAGVLIDPIETKAMGTARQNGQTPFALLKPAKGIPVLVKVMPAPNNKQMLVPATAEDLKSAGKITVSPNFGNNPQGNSIKAVQIKVPVVATVIQRVGPDGQLTIQVEPPGPEQEEEANGGEEKEGNLGEVTKTEPEEGHQQEEVEVDEEQTGELMEDGSILAVAEGEDSQTQVESEEVDSTPRVQYVREDGTLIPEEELQGLGPSAVNLLAAAVNMVHSQGNTASTSQQELLDDLAGEEGIQFVRPSANGGYEVLSQEEAARMMQQPGQTIEILSDARQLQMLEEGEEAAVPSTEVETEVVEETEDMALVNHSNLSALVDAIRSAGYQVTEGQKQIIITDGGEHVLLNESGEPVQQQIVYGDAEQVFVTEEGERLEMVLEEGGPVVQYVIQDNENEGVLPVEAVLGANEVDTSQKLMSVVKVEPM